MALQSLLVPIITQFKSAGINQAKAAVGGLGRTFDSLAKNIGAAAGSFAAFQGLSASRQFILDSIDATQKLERNLIALGQVYGNLSPQLERFGKEVQSYGISQNQAAQASIFIGSVLKQYGFNVGEAADATQRIVKLSQDLATTYGYDVQEALLAVTALFRGEFDPIEKFGVAMKQNEINAELAARGLEDLEGAARENAEAIITLDFLFERASDSVGAFSRATDTLYASQKRLQAATANLQAAFGEPFQKPLAEINNAFAGLIEDNAPGLEEIADKLGEALEAASPIVVQLGENVLKLAQILQAPIEIITALIDIIRPVLLPVLKFFGDGLQIVINALDALSATTSAAIKILRDFADNPVFEFIKDGVSSLGADGFGKLASFIDSFDKGLQRARDNARGFTGDIEGFDAGIKQASTALRGKALASRDDEKAAAELKKQNEALAESLRELAGDTRDVNGELTGLAKLFADVDEAAEKSKAKEALEGIGIEASMIEAILSETNWQQIFEDIAKYARLAAVDITKVGYAAAVGISLAMDEIEGRLGGLFDIDSGGGSVSNAIEDFYDGIQNAIAKESARRRLSRLGASEGLIEAILGASGWEKVFNDVIRRGIDGLQDLQAEFDKTADGIAEVAAEAEALAEAQAEALQAATARAQEYIEELQRQADKLEADYKRARDAADAFLEKLEDFSGISILPDYEAELGRFESAVVGSITKIRSELKSAFRSDLILQSDFDALMQWVATEEELLRRIANQRDDLANRYALSEALINDYRKALTGAFNLTSLFGRLKTETEKRTVTEVSKGIVELENGLKEFAVTVTKSYEETVDVTQDKTAGLLDGFRDMADKARKFAENLQKLRALGLDPMLFNQLVEAGVEAGGETAQALVDGGSKTITEINSLFQEIDEIGRDLGEQVAATMYGAGVDMSQGLLEGIDSERQALLELARELGEAFTSEFESKVSIAIEKPVAQAENAFEAAADAVPDIQEINVQAIADLQTIINDANTALAGRLSTAFREGITEKKFGAMALQEDLLRGLASGIGGITGGMTSADFRAAALGTGGQIVNNYYVEVNSSSRAGGAKAGEAFKEALDKFESVNGNF
jgi:hypothetical protein